LSGSSSVADNSGATILPIASHPALARDRTMNVHDAWDSRYARWQYVVAFWFAVALAFVWVS
jgi:hypothetical protein